MIQIKEIPGRAVSLAAMEKAPVHQRILEWQAEHPTVTWVFWVLVWAFVFYVLFRPTPIRGL